MSKEVTLTSIEGTRDLDAGFCGGLLEFRFGGLEAKLGGDDREAEGRVRE
jgi:hypothetical protein